jgi:CRP-like cAMP-binding protein
VSLFASLGAEDLRALAAELHHVTFARGEVLFFEGDAGDSLYILQLGHVKVALTDPDGAETILYVAGPGECLGELSLVDGGTRSATAAALDDVRALSLHRDRFLALLERRRSVERELLRSMATIVRRVNTQLQDVTVLDVPTRLAKKLLELVDRHGVATPHGVRIDVPVTQQELAQMLGLTRASVNKHLADLEADGIVSTGRGSIVVHCPAALRKRLPWTE